MAALDAFAGPHDRETDHPATRAAAVTPNDSTDLTYASRAIYVGGAGNIKVDTLGGDSAITFVGVPAGTTLAVRATRVYSTSTTATSIVALW